MSQVIAVLNQKGGAGKTTLSSNLASAFQNSGKRTLLVDSDPQGSARDWAAAGEVEKVPVVGLDRPSLDRDIKAISRDFDLVVIDGAPQIKEMAVAAIKAADLILIPVQPSPYDIWAAADLVDLVKARIELTDGKLKAAFVISRAIAGTKLGKEIVDALAEFELPILENCTHQRVIYPTSAARGLSVFDCANESGAQSAIDEIEAIAQEITSYLNK